MKYVYREAVLSDIPAMKYIRDNVSENRLVTMEINEEDYASALFDDGKGWVCVHGGEVVGFCCGRLKQKDVWALFINKEYEGEGIGNQLMELLEKWMFANGIDEIKLSTEQNTRAEKLYRRRNWEPLGILPSHEIELRLKKS